MNILKRDNIIWIGAFVLFYSLYSCRNQSGDSVKNTSATQVVPVKAKTFYAGEVWLINDPVKESKDAEDKYQLLLNEDSLFAPFIIESGITPKYSIYPS